MKKTFSILMILAFTVGITAYMVFDRPSGQQENLNKNVSELKARVLSVENSNVVSSGIAYHRCLRGSHGRSRFPGRAQDKKAGYHFY
ncbi:MAG: hypothetical protein QHH06_13685 [Clostridiales bacterium]|jgi:hypothetical protein|nr:hypothetical protein [Eubacteriales bacterium]MDH7567493.1 hypothetical protein [Clostridiales bacterium]